MNFSEQHDNRTTESEGPHAALQFMVDTSYRRTSSLGVIASSSSIIERHSGDFMTDRMRRYPDLFPGEAVDILAEGEHNGYLDRALNTVAEMYEQRMVPDPNRIIDGEQQIIIGNQIIFLRNLGERLNAGDSIVTSLDQMAMESAIIPPDELRGMAGDIRDKGMKLSEAMQARLQYFKPIVIDYVNAGERGGVLEATLEAAHKYLLRDCM